jgi:hypothetical protein
MQLSYFCLNHEALSPARWNRLGMPANFYYNPLDSSFDTTPRYSSPSPTSTLPTPLPTPSISKSIAPTCLFVFSFCAPLVSKLATYPLFSDPESRALGNKQNVPNVASPSLYTNGYAHVVGREGYEKPTTSFSILIICKHQSQNVRLLESRNQ